MHRRRMIARRVGSRKEAEAPASRRASHRSCEVKQIDERLDSVRKRSPEMFADRDQTPLVPPGQPLRVARVKRLPAGARVPTVGDMSITEGPSNGGVVRSAAGQTR